MKVGRNTTNGDLWHPCNDATKEWSNNDFDDIFFILEMKLYTLHTAGVPTEISDAILSYLRVGESRR
jgi:hypothetical protein